MLLLIFLISNSEPRIIYLSKQDIHYSTIEEFTDTDFNVDKFNISIDAKLPNHIGDQKLLLDSMNTIWFPDTMKAVMAPKDFISPSPGAYVYLIGNYARNIAVCNSETGVREKVIHTGRGTSSLSYSPLVNKLYCGIYFENSIYVIDLNSNFLIDTISLSSDPYKLTYNSVEDRLYCGRYDYIDVIDCNTNSIVDSIKLQSNVSDMVYNPLSNKLYATYIDTLAIIDGSNDTLISKIKMDSYTEKLEFNSISNKIYCANGGIDSVSIIDGVGDSLIKSLPAGDNPKDMVFNPVMNRIYVSNYSGRSISIIDGVADSIVTTINLYEYPLSLAYDSIDNRVFVTTNYRNAIVIDCNTNSQISSLPVGYNPYGILWESNYNNIWIGNTGHSSTGYSFDIYTADTLNHIAKIFTGFSPISSVLDTVENKVFARSMWGSYISIIDLDNPVVSTYKEVGTDPYDVLYNPLENKVYIAISNGDKVSVLDATTNSTLAEIPVQSYPYSLALNSSENKVYCANFNQPSISVIDGTADTLIKNIGVNRYPSLVYWNWINNKIYCAHRSVDSITIIDSHADTLIKGLSIGIWPSDLIFNPNNNSVYCANSGDNSIAVVDGNTDSVVSLISVGSGRYPHKLEINPSSNKLYCANGYKSGDISVIDCSADTVIKIISLPANSSPFNLLYNPADNMVYCGFVFDNFESGIAVIDCESDSIVDYSGIGYYVHSYGYTSPNTSLFLDPKTGVVYYLHEYEGCISAVYFTSGLEEKSPDISENVLFNVKPVQAIGDLKINYSIAGKENAGIKIYDRSGRFMRELKITETTGKNQMSWDLKDKNGNKIASGIYFLILEVDGYKESEKVILLR
jgi:YVTN family beta-propeller protein